MTVAVTKVPPTPWTALDRSLPPLPDKAPAGLTVAATLDAGADGLVGLCRWGEDAWMLVRVPPDGPDLTLPLTPLMSADQIAAIAEEVLCGDQRARTWHSTVNVLAMGVMLAGLPAAAPDDGGTG